MKTNHLFLLAGILSLFVACSPKTTEKKTSGNPIFPGWYADPEGIVFGDDLFPFRPFEYQYVNIDTSDCHHESPFLGYCSFHALLHCLECSG